MLMFHMKQQLKTLLQQLKINITLLIFDNSTTKSSGNKLNK